MPDNIVVGFGQAMVDMPSDGQGGNVMGGGVRKAQTLSVAAGGTISGLLDTGEGGDLVGLELGGSINAAGTLYLLGSSGTVPVSRTRDITGAVVSYVWSAATDIFVLNPMATYPFRYWKVDLGAAQTNGATVKAIMRAL